MNYLVLVLAALCLVVSGLHTLVAGDVRSLQQEFRLRQSIIDGGAQYKQLNNQLINALATIAASAGDDAIKQMLTSEGVTYTVNPSPATVTESAQAEEGGSADE